MSTFSIAGAFDAYNMYPKLNAPMAELTNKMYCLIFQYLVANTRLKPGSIARYSSGVDAHDFVYSPS